jgi:hypothetical protein
LIGRGENRGQKVTYYNVVRNLLKVGDWNGSSGSWTVPLENISRDGVDAAVVYVQDGSREARAPMLGAAYTRAPLVTLPFGPGNGLFRAATRAECQRSVKQPQTKRTNFRWPSIGINSPANRPDPDGPGGWGRGIRNRKDRANAGLSCRNQRGGRWAEVGQ